jgi:hypothetical protein
LPDAQAGELITLSSFKTHDGPTGGVDFRRLLFVPFTLLLLLLATHALVAARTLVAMRALVAAYAHATLIPPAARQSTTRSRIVTASGVRLRERPETGAGEVARLPLGVVVQELERSPDKAKVGTAEDYWYQVAAPDGARGWVFGGLTAPFDPARRVEIYRALANERLGNTAATFNELSDLVRFLDRALKETTPREAHAELELARLSALARSLVSISMEQHETPPYKSWTTEHDPDIVYSEPAGQWFVRADRFWDLQRKYRDLSLAERAAWQAAQTPLPGECEGYLPCHLSVESMTSGNYLKLYPRGPHAEAALASITELLEQVSEDLRSATPSYDVPREERAEFRKSVAELRAQLVPVASPKKAHALNLLDGIAGRFR